MWYPVYALTICRAIVCIPTAMIERLIKKTQKLDIERKKKEDKNKIFSTTYELLNKRLDIAVCFHLGILNNYFHTWLSPRKGINNNKKNSGKAHKPLLYNWSTRISFWRLPDTARLRLGCAACFHACAVLSIPHVPSWISRCCANVGLPNRFCSDRNYVEFLPGPSAQSSLLYFPSLLVLHIKLNWELKELESITLQLKSTENLLENLLKIQRVVNQLNINRMYNRLLKQGSNLCPRLLAICFLLLRVLRG